MTISRVLAVVAAALLIAAAFAGFSTISTDSGVDCGSWIVRDDSKAEHEDSVNTIAGISNDDATVQECQDAVSDKTPIVLILGGLGVASGIAAAASRRQTQSV